jgi:hypothetical protein
MRKIFWRNNVMIDAEDTGKNCNRTVRLEVASGRCILEMFGRDGEGPMMIDSIIIRLKRYLPFRPPSKR